MGHFLWTSNILGKNYNFFVPLPEVKVHQTFSHEERRGEAFLAFWVGWLVFIGIIIAPKNKALLRMKRRKHINATIHILFLGIIVKSCLWGIPFYQPVTGWLQRTKRSFSSGFHPSQECLYDDADFLCVAPYEEMKPCSCDSRSVKWPTSVSTT